jgi:hypothetical protein
MAVGSAAWIAEERSSALIIARSEIDEFSFSARNEGEWLNEHMAEIFSENQMCVHSVSPVHHFVPVWRTLARECLLC